MNPTLTAPKSDMTKDEAENFAGKIVYTYREAMYLLLEFRNRKGHKALGYQSFSECCKNKLNIPAETCLALINQAEEVMQMAGEPLPIARQSLLVVRQLDTLPKRQEVFRRLKVEGVAATYTNIREKVRDIQREAGRVPDDKTPRCNEARLVRAELDTFTTDLIITFCDASGKPGYVRLPERYHKVTE